MKQLIILLILIFKVLYASNDISSGSIHGTYIKIAKDIKKFVANKINLDMNVLESNGSKDNIIRLINDSNVKFAIVQSDIINYLKDTKKRELKNKVNFLRVLVPLYKEEIHIIVRKDSDIEKFSDIKNKKISIGKKGSGTSLTGYYLYTQHFGKEEFKKNYKNGNIIQLSLNDALNKLKNKSLDVIIEVGAQPINALKNEKKLKLLSIDKVMRENYYETIVKKGTYPWLRRDITIPAVYSLLICNKNNKINDDKLKLFAIEFRKELEQLKQQGSTQKWKHVHNNLPALPSSQDWKYCDIFKNTWDKEAKKYQSNNVCTEEMKMILDRCKNK